MAPSRTGWRGGLKRGLADPHPPGMPPCERATRGRAIHTIPLKRFYLTQAPPSCFSGPLSTTLSLETHPLVVLGPPTQAGLLQNSANSTQGRYKPGISGTHSEPTQPKRVNPLFRGRIALSPGFGYALFCVLGRV